jgi:hypothetical protein
MSVFIDFLGELGESLKIMTQPHFCRNFCASVI